MTRLLGAAVTFLAIAAAVALGRADELQTLSAAAVAPQIERFPIVVRTVGNDGRGGRTVTVQAFMRLSSSLPRRANGSSASTSVKVNGEASDATVSRVGASNARYCYATGAIEAPDVQVGQRVTVSVQRRAGAPASTKQATVRASDIRVGASDPRNLIGCGGRKPKPRS